jgi:hypothetical protein
MLNDDVYAEFIIETDGRYGSYAECNPIDGDGHFCCVSNGCAGCARADAAVGYYNLSDITWGPPALPAPYAMWKYNINVLLGAGMAWYSTPAAGECAPGVRPGVGPAGCSWRVAAAGKLVNASCLDTHLWAAVAARGHRCFAACPGAGRNASTGAATDCGLGCFFGTVFGSPGGQKIAPARAMARSDLLSVWARAFASDDSAEGGCPALPPPPTSPDRVAE